MIFKSVPIIESTLNPTIRSRSTRTLNISGKALAVLLDHRMVCPGFRNVREIGLRDLGFSGNRVT